MGYAVGTIAGGFRSPTMASIERPFNYTDLVICDAETGAIIGFRPGTKGVPSSMSAGGVAPVRITGGNRVGDELTAQRGEGWQFTTGRWYLAGVAIGSATAGRTITQLAEAVGKSYAFQPTGLPFRAVANPTVPSDPVPPREFPERNAIFGTPVGTAAGFDWDHGGALTPGFLPVYALAAPYSGGSDAEIVAFFKGHYPNVAAAGKDLQFISSSAVQGNTFLEGDFTSYGNTAVGLLVADSFGESGAVNLIGQVYIVVNSA